jgi:hypothetical protein
MTITNENRQIWLDFFRAAEAFRDLKPWEWMYDSDLFGVQDPVSGKIGYCCVMGNLGEHFGITIYSGEDGLNSYYEMLEFGQDDPMMAGLRQNCLSISFEDREDLPEQDRKFFKALGVKFRGRKQWVLAQEFSPGYLPWHISEAQVPFLTVALQQAVNVASSVRENSEMLQFDEEKVLVRVPKPMGNSFAWENQISDMPDINTSIALKPIPSLMQKAKQMHQSDAALLLSLAFAPSPTRVDAKSRPFFPMIAVLMEQEQGVILAFEMFQPDELEAKIQHWLLGAFEKTKDALPQKLIMSNGYGASLLEDIVDEMGIELYVSPDDPKFREVMEMMFQFM